MRLPTPKEIEGLLFYKGAFLSLSQIEEALRDSLWVLELLSREPVRKRTIREKKLINQEGQVSLSLFPIRDPRIEGQSQDSIPHLGLIFPDLPPSNYTITYTVGYEPDDFPMIMVSAVTNLVTYRLTGDQEAAQSAIAEIQVLRSQYLEKKRDRENGEAS